MYRSQLWFALTLVTAMMMTFARTSASSRELTSQDQTGTYQMDRDVQMELRKQHPVNTSVSSRNVKDGVLVMRDGDGPCPSECICSSHGRVVRCEHAKLRDIPTGIPTTVTELYLGYNQLTSITANSFSTLTNITILSLKGNEIYDILPGAFNQLRKMKSLFLTNNKLVNIPSGVFVGLDSLQKIYFTQNVLTSIPDMSTVPTLTRLNLDNNKLPNFTFPSSFAKLTNLTSLVLNDNPTTTALLKDDLKPLAGAKIAKLDLSRCGIEKIENGTLLPLTGLKSLQLNYLPLSKENVKAVIDGLAGSQLTALGLSGSLQEDDLPSDTFQALLDVPLLQLTLSNNKISVIPKHLFIYFPKLVLLDFSHSSIRVAAAEAFKGLDSLTTLRMHINNFLDLPTDLPATLEIIDFSYNPTLTTIKDGAFRQSRQLKELRLHHCTIEKIEEDAFSGIEILQYLDLSYNALAGNALAVKLLKNLNQLTYFSLKRNNIQHIKGESDVFAGLVSLDTMDLRDNHLDSIPKGIFAPLTKLRFLHLDNNNLGDVLSKNGDVFSGMANLTELHLVNNDIRHLSGGLFSSLPRLQEVDLANNVISGWDGELFEKSPSLKQINLSTNRLTLINETSVGGLQPPLSLNLSQNPFSCHCDLIWFRNWVETTNITLANLTNYTCASPKNMAGQTLLEFNPDSINFQCNWLVVTLVSVGCLTALFILLVTLSYRFRWKLRWYMYRFKRRMAPHRSEISGDYESLAGDTFMYDAFISVTQDADDDVEFVEEHLLSRMDNGWTEDGSPPTGVRTDHKGNYRLFYEQLHLARGAAASSLSDAMENACKMILVMSNTYLRHDRCRHFDYEIAMAKVRQYGYAAVILVMMPGALEEALPSGLRPKLDDPDTNQGPLYWTENEDGQRTFWEELEKQFEYRPAVNLQI